MICQICLICGCIWRKNALGSGFWLPDFETNLCRPFHNVHVCVYIYIYIHVYIRIYYMCIYIYIYILHVYVYIYIILLLTPPFNIHLLYALILRVKTLVSEDKLASKCTMCTILYTSSMCWEDLQSGSNPKSIVFCFLYSAYTHPEMPMFPDLTPPCSLLNFFLCVSVCRSPPIFL